MGIVVKQFNGSSVTPKDDAVMNELIFQSYGIFNGCGISFLGVNQLMINSGRMIIKGRQAVITEETIAAQLSSGGTKRGRLYIRIDLSSPDTPAVFLTQVADELPVLTQQDDVNYNDGIFEIELCNYDVSETAISNIVESCPMITGSVDMLKSMEELLANTEEGKAVDSLVVKQLADSLVNEDNETFNFGIKDGVRGFYTNPSRADDSFVPFIGNTKLMLLGIGTRFNISDIVGTENVGKYTTDDFIMIPDFTSAITSSIQSVAYSGGYTYNGSYVRHSVSLKSESKLTYDNTTGDVIITDAVLYVAYALSYQNNTNTTYNSKSNTVKIPTKVYLLKKT